MYHNQSESIRSLEAKERGLFPASYLAKKLKKYYPNVTAEDVKNSIHYAEWHHTSCRYNATEFYDFAEFGSFENRKKLKETINERLANTGTALNRGIAIIAWSGSRNYPTKTTYWIEKAKITKTGAMNTIEPAGKIFERTGENKYWTKSSLPKSIRKKNYEVNVKEPEFIKNIL